MNVHTKAIDIKIADNISLMNYDQLCIYRWLGIIIHMDINFHVDWYYGMALDVKLQLTSLINWDIYNN